MIPSLRQSAVHISCIICAYNEAPRIAAVLRVAGEHPLLHEIIVVDDGSTDETAAIVKQFSSVRLISGKTNRGKSFAVATGVAAAEGELLMLLDDDLSGLAAEHISALATPVLSGQAAVSISLRRNSLLIFRAIGLDFVSGERVVRKVLLSEVLEEVRDLPRFGIEVFMNRRIIAQRRSIAVTRWPRVSQSRKAEKLGFWKGIRAEWRMIVDLLDVAYPRMLLSQTWHLLSLQANRHGVAEFAYRIINPSYCAR
jgi:hypothetical protein